MPVALHAGRTHSTCTAGRSQQTGKTSGRRVRRAAKQRDDFKLSRYVIELHLGAEDPQIGTSKIVWFVTNQIEPHQKAKRPASRPL